MSVRPDRGTVFRDTASYLMGVILLAKQAGIGFTPPMAPNTMLILIGALLIGVPGVAQLIAATGRFGASASGSTTEQRSLPQGERLSLEQRSHSVRDGDE